jgi:hypothetical protein
MITISVLTGGTDAAQSQSHDRMTCIATDQCCCGAMLLTLYASRYLDVRIQKMTALAALPAVGQRFLLGIKHKLAQS